MAGRDVRPDTVIYATGYTQEFGFFDKKGKYATPDEADIRNVAKTGDESVGFIGFVRPGVGELTGNRYIFAPHSLKFDCRCNPAHR
jgi:dimethylaniline monooxygenase (N-oxide forming)